MTLPTLSTRLYFSYSQFMVYDHSEQMPGCEWTDEHTKQGFARRESTVCFGTLLVFGYAYVAMKFGAYQGQANCRRVIAVPFHCTSGKVTVEGPEEMDASWVFEAPSGHYKLTAAQAIIGDDEERIDLFFDAVAAPLKHSIIVLADELLNPTEPLIETSEVAGA